MIADLADVSCQFHKVSNKNASRSVGFKSFPLGADTKPLRAPWIDGGGWEDIL
jgi:hypothetical protein